MKKLYAIIVFAIVCAIVNAQGVWNQKTNFGGGVRISPSCFSIGTMVYIGLGSDGNNYFNDFWEYDPANNTWTQKANFGGTARSAAITFSIGSKGYIGTGLSSGPIRYQDLWEWDQATNIWTQKANFSGVARNLAVGFSIGNKGYIGTGFDGTNYLNDFWEWDGDTTSVTYNTWTQKANFGGTSRYAATGFSIGTKGYIGTGFDDLTNDKQDFWEWNQATNMWTQKADLPSAPRRFAIGFSIDTNGYIGTGFCNACPTPYQKDIWRWNQTSNSWIRMPDFGGGERAYAVGVSIGTKAYVGTGTILNGSWIYYNDFWELTTCIMNISGTNTICSGKSISLSASGSATYSWNTGLTSSSIFVSPSATVTYTVVGSIGSCSDTAFTKVTVNISSASLTLKQDTVNPLTWYGYTVITGTAPFTYHWSFGDGDSSSLQYPTHTYSISGHYAICLTVTDAKGCSNSTCDSTYRIAAQGIMQFLITNPFVTGIKSLQSINDISIYPNPTSGEFNLSMNQFENLKMTELKVYNVFGECINRQIINSPNQQIDLHQAPNGIYFLQLKTEQGTAVKKLVVSH